MRLRCQGCCRAHHHAYHGLPKAWAERSVAKIKANSLPPRRGRLWAKTLRGAHGRHVLFFEHTHTHTHTERERERERKREAKEEGEKEERASRRRIRRNINARRRRGRISHGNLARNRGIWDSRVSRRDSRLDPPRETRISRVATIARLSSRKEHPLPRTMHDRCGKSRPG